MWDANRVEDFKFRLERIQDTFNKTEHVIFSFHENDEVSESNIN